MKEPRSGTARLCLWGLHSCSHLVVALLLLHGSVLFQACAEVVEMRYDDAKILCLYVKWNVNFSVSYETEKHDYKTAEFTLPDDAEYAGSDCGGDELNILAVKFGHDNYWNLSFTKSGDTYEGIISFTYNTNDTALFPGAKRKGPVTVITKYPEQPIELNMLFKCDGPISLQAENVTQYIWELALQAFISEGVLSQAKRHCSQDMTTTPEPLETTTEVTTTSTTPSTTPEESTTPTTPVTTITTTSVNSTTVPPTTTMPPTTRPSITPQPWARPGAGTYSVKDNGTICLLATMALQLNVSEQTEALLFNINPNATEASGVCGNTTASLTLKNEGKQITFVFAVKNTTNEAFFLKEVKITTVGAANETRTVSRTNMNTWEATLGSSFMCQKESVLEVTPFNKLNVYSLHVQPFEVRDDQFSTAEECYTHQFKYLIPIIVAAVVAFLLLVVFVIYVRRRRGKEADSYTT